MVRLYEPMMEVDHVLVHETRLLDEVFDTKSASSKKRQRKNDEASIPKEI